MGERERKERDRWDWRVCFGEERIEREKQRQISNARTREYL